MATRGRRLGWWATVLAASSLGACACGGGETPDDDSGGRGGQNGAGGGSTTPGALTIVQRFPDEGSDHLDTRRPVRVTFDAELDEDSAADAVSVQVGSEEIEADVEVDGESLLVTLGEIPPLPATLTVTIGADLRGTNGAAFGGDSFNLGVPFWQEPAGELGAGSEVALGVGGDDTLLFGRTRGSTFEIGTYSGESWVMGEAPLASGTVRLVGVAELDDGELLVSWIAEDSTETLHAAVQSGDEWEPLDVIASGANLVAAFAEGADGTPRWVVSAAPGDAQVFEFSGDEVESVGPSTSIGGGAVRELALARGTTDPVVALVDGARDVIVRRLEGTSWDDLGTIERAWDDGAARPDVAVAGDEVFVAYVDAETYEVESNEVLVSTHVHVARSTGAEFQRVGAALDVDLDANADFPRFAQDDDERLYAAWVETRSSSQSVFVSWLDRGDSELEDDFRILGQEALGEFEGDPNDLELVLDADGFPVIALGADDESHVRRFNGSPSLPNALAGRTDRGECEIPEDGDGFPTTLTATGCYADIARRRLVPAAIPYNLNSPLWSDGAHKERYLLLPEGETVAFETTGELGMPVGTVIIKEFYLERTVGDSDTRFPVETRFLVKRCEEEDCSAPWQGYSYRWNEAGTNGTLLDAGAEVEWDVVENGADSVHTHVYPSRSQCVECHSRSSGRVLGLRAPQLKRPEDYGEFVDSQLAAWARAGLFGQALEDDALEGDVPEHGVERLPSPADVSRTLTERSLSYFESNCAHCHHPDRDTGSQPLTNFRYGAEGLRGGSQPEANICDQLVPGTHDESILYLRDSTRDPLASPTQMPPIATLKPDRRQLPITAAWIDSLTTTECPPP